MKKSVKGALESDLDELFADPHKATALKCTKLMQKHTRRVKNWPKFLRRLADYLEEVEEPLVIELSPRSLSEIIHRAMGDRP